jgi:hypothetical protein
LPLRLRLRTDIPFDRDFSRPYSADMQLKISVNEKLFVRARQVARLQGTSLNALIRDYIEVLAGGAGGDEILREFEAMWEQPGNSGGKPFQRSELYESRLHRYTPR